MEDNKNKKSNLPQWKCEGGSFTKKDGTRIEAGRTFEAKEEDIPKAFRDVIIKVTDSTEEIKKPVKQKPKESVFRKSESRKEKGFFNVYNKSNKKLNETLLTEEEADKLIESLEN